MRSGTVKDTVSPAGTKPNRPTAPEPTGTQLDYTANSLYHNTEVLAAFRRQLLYPCCMAATQALPEAAEWTLVAQLSTM